MMGTALLLAPLYVTSCWISHKVGYQRGYGDGYVACHLAWLEGHSP